MPKIGEINNDNKRFLSEKVPKRVRVGIDPGSTLKCRNALDLPLLTRTYFFIFQC